MRAVFTMDDIEAEAILSHLSSDAVWLTDSQGLDALHFAIYRGNARLVELILLKGRAHYHTQPPDKKARYMYLACEHGHVGVVKALIQLGGVDGLRQPLAADPGQCGAATSATVRLAALRAAPAGDTCLHLASDLGHLDVVRELVAHGGRPLLLERTAHGLTALIIAAQRGHTDVVRTLVAAGGVVLLLLAAAVVLGQVLRGQAERRHDHGAVRSRRGQRRHLGVCGRRFDRLERVVRQRRVRQHPDHVPERV